MNIPQNKELFNNVIKFADEGRNLDGHSKKDENLELEDQIREIRERIAGKINKVECVNHLEFLQFIMANYDYNHDYWKLNKDLTLKLKEEEARDAFMVSQGSLTNFQQMMRSTSNLQNQQTKPSMNMTQQSQLKFSPSNETFNLTQGPFGSGNLIHFDDEESNKSENENRRKSIAINLLNSPSEESM